MTELTPEQQAARAPLVEAGWRILELLGRVSDQATEEQTQEARRTHRALCAIWNEALEATPTLDNRGCER